jgi:hypothetical protein
MDDNFFKIISSSGNSQAKPSFFSETTKSLLTQKVASLETAPSSPSSALTNPQKDSGDDRYQDSRTEMSPVGSPKDDRIFSLQSSVLLAESKNEFPGAKDDRTNWAEEFEPDDFGTKRLLEQARQGLLSKVEKKMNALEILLSSSVAQVQAQLKRTREFVQETNEVEKRLKKAGIVAE